MVQSRQCLMEELKRGPRVAGRRDVNRMLSFLPCLLHTPQTTKMPPTEALWFALSYCMRHDCMENYSRVIVPLGICLLNKKILSGGMGGTPTWENQLLSSQNALGDAVWMSVLWTITGIHRTANTDGNLGKMRTQGQWGVRLSGGPHITGHASRLQSHFTAWHSIPILRRGFVSPDDGFFFKVMICGLPKALSALWATSISYNEWQFFLEIFNYGDTQKKSNY